MVYFCLWLFIFVVKIYNLRLIKKLLKFNKKYQTLFTFIVKKTCDLNNIYVLVFLSYDNLVANELNVFNNKLVKYKI